MKANELSIGWAITQKNPDDALRRVIANVKAYGRRNASRLARLVADHRDTIVSATAGTAITLASFCLIYLAAVLQ